MSKPSQTSEDAPSATGVAARPEEGYSKKHPFPAPLLRSVLLTGEDSPKEIYHVEYSLAGSGFDYEVGDALGVFPRNPDAAVDELLAMLPFNPADPVPLPDGGAAPLRAALIANYDLRTLTKPLLTKWLSHGGSPTLHALIEGDDKLALDHFIRGREVIDLVFEHRADFPDAGAFVSLLRKLQPRLYSIASSPRVHPAEAHLTVAAVRYHAHGRERRGVCSCFIAAGAPGELARVFVHHNKGFRLPADPATPIIMVGPGTGIAPFRAFLEERRAVGATGRNWLIFGNPHRVTGFLYEAELAAMQRDGTLHRLDLAWSRDQRQKVYVQDKLREAAAEVWAWLQEGASLYVCGDAGRMATDVELALEWTAESQGGMSPEAAAEFVKRLRREKRYLRDVY
jgi:sulfite reductase (NADPH) flavoprotein alpha-component